MPSQSDDIRKMAAGMATALDSMPASTPSKIRELGHRDTGEILIIKELLVADAASRYTKGRVYYVRVKRNAYCTRGRDWPDTNCYLTIIGATPRYA